MNNYLRYAIVGKDSVFSFAPVILGEDRFILCDGLYDLADSPLESEMVLLAMPKAWEEYVSHGWGEYWNPVTRLLVEFAPEEEGFFPDTKPDGFEAIKFRREKSKMCYQGDDRVIPRDDGHGEIRCACCDAVLGENK